MTHCWISLIHLVPVLWLDVHPNYNRIPAGKCGLQNENVLHNSFSRMCWTGKHFWLQAASAAQSAASKPGSNRACWRRMNFRAQASNHGEVRGAGEREVGFLAGGCLAAGFVLWRTERTFCLGQTRPMRCYTVTQPWALKV